MLAVLDGVFEDAARQHAPGVVGSRAAELPAGRVLAVEQGLEAVFGISRSEGERPESHEGCKENSMYCVFHS